jgi:integrase
MTDQPTTQDTDQQPPKWSRKKKDNAPRGVFRHPSGVWAVRFTCGAGHLHKAKVGPVKGDAIRAYHDRRARAHAEAGWCPATEREQARTRATAERARERSRVAFRQAADDYATWWATTNRSIKTTRGELRRMKEHFGDTMLDAIDAASIERFLSAIRTGKDAVAAPTVNRYRDRLSGLFKRAVRLGLVTANPCRGIVKSRESAGRVVYLLDVEEAAVRDQLAPELRPLFAFAVNMGLRWSEQAALTWRDVDMLAGVATIGRSKNGTGRGVPMNSTVRSLLVSLGSERQRPDDASALVFHGAYRTVNRALHGAVDRAQAALREAGKDASRLDGFTWHGCRHTFASRLAMAGVDLRTIQELGGWKTLSMVQRYSHLSSAHLAAAVERLVPTSGAPELSRNFTGAGNAPTPKPAGVS